jgi:hypothetical protein
MRPLLAITALALLLAAPAALAATPEELALGQERAYMQAAPPTAAVDRALAQERTYTQTATVGTAPPAPAPEPAGPPVALLAAVAATLLLAALGVIARRRHIRAPAVLRSAP